MTAWLEPFSHSFVRWGVADALVLSLASGLLGTWIVLRGLSFYSHAVGPAAFPGVVLAAVLGLPPAVGAFGAALLFAGALDRLSRGRRGSYDSLTAVALLGMLAAGVLLASDVFHSGSEVDSLLFGSLILVGPAQIALGVCAAAAVLAATGLLGGAWVAIGFDAQSARSMRLHVATYDSALLVLTALVAAAAVSAVGSLLTTALFVVPAATVRPWVNSMPCWQLWSVLLALLESVVGMWLSVMLNTPPGPTIALSAGLMFGLSVLVVQRHRA